MISDNKVRIKATIDRRVWDKMEAEKENLVKEEKYHFNSETINWLLKIYYGMGDREEALAYIAQLSKYYKL